MERSKQIQIGLLALVVFLLVANLFGGGFSKWFGKSESDRIREKAAAMMAGKPDGQVYATSEVGNLPAEGTASNALGSGGNIPGTNVNVPAAPTGPLTTIKYDSDRFDFGVVDEGEVVKHIFKFTNTGKEPLVISNAKGSCGCTVPTWPKEPIPPGATGELKVEFNSKGKPGQQSKRVTVTANTVPTETMLEIAGEVRGKEQPAAKGAGH